MRPKQFPVPKMSSEPKQFLPSESIIGQGKDSSLGCWNFFDGSKGFIEVLKMLPMFMSAYSARGIGAR